jgi:hypothetical protein
MIGGLVFRLNHELTNGVKIMISNFIIFSLINVMFKMVPVAYGQCYYSCTNFS